MEAYTNRYASPKAKKNALEAVKLIYKYLPIAYSDGKNIEARDKMLLASFNAGVAITNAYVGYIHAIAHGVGRMYSITHGLANAVGIKKGNDDANAKAFIASLRQLNHMMAIPDQLEEIQGKDYNELINRAMTEANPTYPVPVIWGEKEFVRVLNKTKVASAI